MYAMDLYYSSFITGFDKIIPTWMAADLPGAKILRVMDGAVLFSAELGGRSEKLEYLNNTFLVLDQFDGNAANINVQQRIEAPFKTFKLVTMRENQPSKLDGKIAARLIDRLEAATGAKFESRPTDGRASPSGEFWIMTRSDGPALFMMRVTKHSYSPARGEIRPELAHILCRLSEPASNDVMLDPFCGSGAIILERSRIKDYRGVFASDISSDAIAVLKSKTRKIKQAKFNKSVFIKQRDFFANDFNAAFFDCIITDPPWGEFAPIAPDFYDKFLFAAARILKSGGRMVLLCPRRSAFGAFRVVRSFDILANGKKAGVYLLAK